MFKCDECQEEFARGDMLFDDSGAQTCVDCNDALMEAASAYWYAQWVKSPQYIADDAAYDLTDPKRSDWAERVLEAADV